MPKSERKPKFEMRTRLVAFGFRISGFEFHSSFICVFALLVAVAFPSPATASAETPSSPYAELRPVGLSEVQWTSGFWADRLELSRQKTIPALWAIMQGTNYSQFYENFRLAAGLAEGRHRGAPFNDGDFYKWLEAASALLAVTNDPTLDQRLDEIIAVVAKAQRADGYLHTPVLIAQRNQASTLDTRRPTPFEDRLQFEMYNLGHLLTAACVHYRATGKTNLLAVAQKAADFLDETFRNPTAQLARNSICPSHYMGMIELYRVTREPRYLELAKKLLAMRDLVAEGSDDNQDRVPFAQQTNAMGHAVRANYLYAGAADLFAETGDQALWQPLERIWTNAIEQKMYITGGCGALYDGASPDGLIDQKSISHVHQAYGRNYQLPNLTAHNETCANIGNVLWNWRMFLITGEARFMDVVELALYNAVLSGVSLDGTNFFYVNPLRTTQPLPTELRWQHRRVPFMNSFCCPPNLARAIAESASFAYSLSPGDRQRTDVRGSSLSLSDGERAGVRGDAIWVNLYGGNELKTKLPSGQTVKLSQETEYPWNGRIRLTIKECGSAPFALKLRIPGWASRANLRLNEVPLGFPLPGGEGQGEGKETVGPPHAAVSVTPASCFELRRVWRAGDTVDLAFPMPPRLIEANPLVEETRNQIAIQRGPLVYCLESTDLPRGVRLSDITIPADIDLIARFDRRLLGGVVVLEGKALARSSRDWTGQLYRELPQPSLKPVEVRLIPYFAWANRGRHDMSVWLPLSPK